MSAIALTKQLPAHIFIERIEQLEIYNSDLIEIIKRLTADNKGLKERLEILEEILSNWLPIVGKDEE